MCSSRLRALGFCSILACLSLSCPARAEDPPASPDSAMVRMLKSGRIPEERLGTILEMIGKRGNAADLSFLFGRVLKGEGSPVNRRTSLNALAEAALTRGLRPEGDLARIKPLLVQKQDPAARLAAVKLAGLWQVSALQGDLTSLAEAPDASDALRAAALDAIAAIGGGGAMASIDALTRSGKPGKTRTQAVAALVRLDPRQAAERAVEVLRDAGKDQDFAPMLAPFLNRKEGADLLAEVLTRETLPADAAKLALRAVYALGHSDASLVSALNKAAGIDAEVKPLDKDAMDQLIAEVASQGDPRRGETVFRRADVNCSKCHAISGAGGGVGPDLSAIGGSSPVDYLIHSIMLPDQSIKEEFQTLVVLTLDGQVFQGVVADRDDKRILLKEATGETRMVPTADVEETKVGGSLMPKGLVNFLTRAEMVDLLRFLSELGKPGDFAVRSTPTIQRWRYLNPADGELVREVPSAASFRAFALEAEPSRWAPYYALAGGNVLLDEIAAATGSKVLYLQGEVEASQAGPVSVRLNDAKGVHAWLDDTPIPLNGQSFDAELPAGRHPLTFRVDAAKRGPTPLRVEVLKPSGSSAEYAVVGGR